ncbi:MAG: ferredoxin [Bacteroidales bacterium]|nr:ferredoxin [Bacteroidales bacterium]
MIRITHHRINCIGCGYCNEVAPYRWHMNDKDGKSNLVAASGKKEIYTIVVADDEWEDNKEAAELCPVKIIKVEKV